MPTPPPSIIMPSFQEQVCNWLSEMHFPFTLIEDGDFSTRILIIKDDVPALKIVLMNLKSWLNQGSFESWQNEIEHLRTQRENGQKCVMIWEDYWIKKSETVKSRLNAMLGRSQKIAARLTQVRRIDQENTVRFLEKNHLNGSVSAKTRYGLFLQKRYFRILEDDFEFNREADELLVAVATFSAPRVFTRVEGPFRSFEMLRFASLLHTNVSGGLDKLLTAFVREKSPDDIMTYADQEWSDGRGYAKLGFERISETEPMPIFLETNVLVRTSKPKPEAAMIYNAGSIKFVKTFKIQN